MNPNALATFPALAGPFFSRSRCIHFSTPLSLLYTKKLGRFVTCRSRYDPPLLPTSLRPEVVESSDVLLRGAKVHEKRERNGVVAFDADVVGS